MTWRIPLSGLNYGAEEERAVVDVLRGRWLSMGPRTEAMESRFADYLGVRHAIAVSNCTVALELVFSEILCPVCATGDGPTSPSQSTALRHPYVIVPDLTFVATANAAFNSGARVVTADLAPGSAFPGRAEIFDAIERAGGGRPAAIVAVHYAGFDAGTAKLLEVADELGCPLVEDAAHAIGGTTPDGRALGTSGLAGCYSFFSNKNLATGEGGLVATNDDSLARALRLRRSHGMTSLTWQRHQSHPRPQGYDVLAAGHNLRITEITAALALVQLEKLDAGNRRRRELWTRYVEGLDGRHGLLAPLGGANLRLQPPGPATGHNLDHAACHIFPILAPTPAARDKIRDALHSRQIQTSHHYPPIHAFEFWSKAMGDAQAGPDGICAPRPNSADFASREITLPLHPGLSDSDQAEVIDALLEAAAS